MYRAETSSVDKLVALKSLAFNLCNTSSAFLIDQNRFLPDISPTNMYFAVLNYMFLIAVRQNF